MPPAKTPPSPGTKKGRRGIVAFDLDGTLLDDMQEIGRTAARVLHEVFGTPEPEAEQEYFRTTGKPFELQLTELYPDSTEFERVDAARKFHEAKVRDAYAHASFFPEVPRVLKRLDRAGWVLVISTGAEREMAEVVLEREGLGFLFEEVRGAGQGTKDEHLRSFREKWPGLSTVLVGDSRFDMETGGKVPGVLVCGRACRFPTWEISPADLRRWGAAWADYSLERLPEALENLYPPAGPGPAVVPRAGSRLGLPDDARGAQVYSGRKACDVESCRRQAQWKWHNAFLCTRHLVEEARSSVHRAEYLAESREAARSPKKRTGPARDLGDPEP